MHADSLLVGMQDVFKLYAFALALNAVIFIPYAVRAAHFHQTAADVVLRVLDTIVHSAPPGLPAIMLFCGVSSKVRLKHKGINLVFIGILKTGADTMVACFDKTGTLTGSLVRTTSRCLNVMTNAAVSPSCQLVCGISLLGPNAGVFTSALVIHHYSWSGLLS